VIEQDGYGYGRAERDALSTELAARIFQYPVQGAELTASLGEDLGARFTNNMLSPIPGLTPKEQAEAVVTLCADIPNGLKALARAVERILPGACGDLVSAIGQFVESRPLADLLEKIRASLKEVRITPGKPSADDLVRMVCDTDPVLSEPGDFSRGLRLVVDTARGKPAAALAVDYLGLLACSIEPGETANRIKSKIYEFCEQTGTTRPRWEDLRERIRIVEQCDSVSGKIVIVPDDSPEHLTTHYRIEVRLTFRPEGSGYKFVKTIAENVSADQLRSWPDNVPDPWGNAEDWREVWTFISTFSRQDVPYQIEFVLPPELMDLEVDQCRLPSNERFGDHHPVIVRSLDRYQGLLDIYTTWLSRSMTHNLNGGRCYVKERYGWLLANGQSEPTDRPGLSMQDMQGLKRWLGRYDKVTFFALTFPYQREHQTAIDQVMKSGIPAFIWLRKSQDGLEPIRELMIQLADMEIGSVVHQVFQFRQRDALFAEKCVSGDITLFWDDAEDSGHSFGAPVVARSAR
jgi:hypothetical protein